MSAPSRGLLVACAPTPVRPERASGERSARLRVRTGSALGGGCVRGARRRNPAVLGGLGRLALRVSLLALGGSARPALRKVPVALGGLGRLALTVSPLALGGSARPVPRVSPVVLGGSARPVLTAVFGGSARAVLTVAFGGGGLRVPRVSPVALGRVRGMRLGGLGRSVVGIGVLSIVATGFGGGIGAETMRASLGGLIRSGEPGRSGRLRGGGFLLGGLGLWGSLSLLSRFLLWCCSRRSSGCGRLMWRESLL